MEGYWIVIIVLAGLAIFYIALKLIGYAIVGFLWLFAWAAAQGFVGIAVFIACWVFMLPVMAVLSVIVGFFTWRSEADADDQYNDNLMTINSEPLSAEELDEKWKAEDRRYEEAKAKIVEASRRRDKSE